MAKQEKKGKKVLIYVAAAVLVIVGLLIWYINRGGEADGGNSLYTEYSGYAPENSYMAYLEEHSGAEDVSDVVDIPVTEYSASQGEIEVFEEYEGQKNVILTDSKGYVEWTVNVPKTGFYQMHIDYLAYEGSGLRVERSVYIDGEAPYDEAQYLRFERCFVDVPADISVDLDGNDIRPSQKELFIWQEKMLTDASGFFAEPLKFYLTQGQHTIRLNAEREPLMIASLTLRQEEKIPTYEEYRAAHAGGEISGGAEIRIIQAEDMYQRSEKSNYPINDRTSPYTQPQNAYTVLLNSMGGTRWQSVGSSVSWIVTVEETGYYRIAPRYKQDYVSGIKVYRKLLIDGEVPFQEASTLVFNYDSGWQCKALGNGTEEYLFWFEAGREYVLELEVALGDMDNILRRVEASVEELNSIYRSILMVTGATPDKYRDYMFEKSIPQTLESLGVQADELAEIMEEFERVNGANGERMAQLTKMEYLVRRMAEEPDEIAGKFSTFKDNIAALASWVLEMSNQPLCLDYIALVPENAQIPEAEGGFLEKLAYQGRLFLASFTMDYSRMGITEESEGNSESISVWLSTGRDQMNTIRSLINSDFTKKTGITVELELVSGGTLLPSVLAGTGPDVALANGIGDPINLALRNSVYDLSSFEDYDEVIARFPEEAMVPYTYKGKTYALPETMSFNMLFYRRDIFEELGLSVPQTWTEWDSVISELSKKNMKVGLPHDQNMLLTFMYQMNSELYNNEGESVNLDSREAFLCFEKLTEYYNLYDFPKEYDFVNRFRTGEMPLAIADYTIYNQLSLFAPEIQGEWGMTLVPGTVGKDGTVNRTIPFTGTSTVILSDTDQPDAAWKFLKWWTSAEVQAAYCNEMETVINASAKQPTANLEALKQLPWASGDLESLLQEWEFLKGTPEVPGGYYVGRTYTFAFNRVVNDKEDPSDTLQKYIESINSELSRKRREFGITD